MKTHVDWDKVEEGYTVRLGNIGVDSATIALGDETEEKQLVVFTAEGDGGFPVFAKKIDGRRCLIIDFDLVDYDTEGIFYNQELLPDGEENFENGIEGEAHRLCPKCEGKIVQGSMGIGKSTIVCKNGHETVYTRDEFTDYVNNY